VASRGYGLGPLDPWAALFAQTRFLLDCNAVVALRLMRIAGGGEVGAREAVRMITEKIETFAGANLAAAAAMPLHGLPGAAAAAERRYHRAVSRNRRRLSAG